MAKGSDNPFPSVLFVEGSAPSSPAATNFRLYYDSADHLLKWKNSAGTIFPIAYAEFPTGQAVVATSQTTTSTSFADLATAGPSVTVPVGASGKVKYTVSGRASNSSATENYFGIVISGANTVAAATKMILSSAVTTNQEASRSGILTGLAAGSTTFKVQYAVLAGTGTFVNRELIIEPVI